LSKANALLRYSPGIMSKREDSIPDIEAAVREQLLPAIAELKVTQEKLRVLQESLPVTPDRGEEDMDVVTELRSVIDCVLLDSVGPAIRDLLEVAAYVSKNRKPGER
jgi:hypothetical protein